MRNHKQIIDEISSKKFSEFLIENNKKALKYYNSDLGFGDFKNSIEDAKNMSSEQIFRICDQFFTYDKVQKIIAQEAECAAISPFYGSSFQPLDGGFFSGIVAASTDTFTAILMTVHGYEVEVAKRRMAGDRRTLSFGGVDTYVRVYKSNQLKIRKWRIPEFTDSDDLTVKPMPLVDLGVVCFTDDDRMHLDASESFEYCCEAGASGLVLQIQMHQNGRPMGLEFDYDTGKLVGASSTSQEPTRLQMLATAMRIFDRQDAFADVLQLTKHPLHFVRWHAMRECLGLDAQRALTRLQVMSEHDPQPSVRRAANQTLERFFPEFTAIAAE